MGLVHFPGTFPNNCDVHFVVIFHIKATYSPLSALVFMSQIIVYTFRMNLSFRLSIENEVQGLSYVAFQVLLTLCGIWSLDFFRSVVPPFCVSSNIKTLHGLALEYLVAFYPIFLIFITYVTTSMTTTSDQLFGCGNHFTDILFTSGDGTPKHP